MGAGRISLAALALLCAAPAVARAGLTPMPGSLAFPNTPTNAQSAAQTITWTNTGGQNVTIANIAMAGTNPGDFQLSNGPPFPLSLVPNASITIDCAFAPQNGGLRQATVSATVNGMNGTVDVPVSGTGIGPKITVAPSPIVCGNLPAGQLPPPVTVTVSNAGGAVDHVSGVTLSGPNANLFSTSGLPQFPVALSANQSFTFNLQFTPAMPGQFTATLNVASDDPNTPMLATPITGNSGDPKIALDVGTIIFGNQRIGIASVSQDVNISNNGLSDLHVSAITLSGPNPGDFAFTAKPMLPATIPIGKSVKLSVDFTPTAAGARQAQVVISSDDPQAPTKTVPVTGTGTTAMASVMPNKIDFGNVKVTTQGGGNFTIANAGSGPVKVTSLMVTGNDAKLFSVPMAAPFSVPAMGQVVVQVNFKPVTIGMFSATVNGATDDPNLPNFQVALAGAGTSPMFAAKPNSLDFGSITLGMSAPAQTITLSNGGNQPLTIMTFGVMCNQFVMDYPIMNAPKVPLVMMPGDKASFSVAFKPSVDGGEPCSINLTTDDPSAVSVNLALSGFGRQPQLTLSPMGALDFAMVQVGTTTNKLPGGMPAILEIQNYGDADLDVTSVKVTGGMMASAFSIDPMAAGGFTVAANQTKKVAVTFAPVMVGMQMGTIEVTSSDQGVMTATLGVKGIGVAPMIVVTPPSIDFGPIAVGETSMAEAFTIKNTGANQFVIDHVTTSNPAFGPAMDNLNMPVDPMASVELMATFAPMMEGDFTGSLAVYLKGSTVPGAMVAVKGSGVTPKSRGGSCAIGARGTAKALGPLALLLVLGLALRRKRRSEA